MPLLSSGSSARTGDNHLRVTVNLWCQAIIILNQNLIYFNLFEFLKINTAAFLFVFYILNINSVVGLMEVKSYYLQIVVKLYIHCYENMIIKLNFQDHTMTGHINQKNTNIYHVYHYTLLKYNITIPPYIIQFFQFHTPCRDNRLNDSFYTTLRLYNCLFRHLPSKFALWLWTPDLHKARLFHHIVKMQCKLVVLFMTHCVNIWQTFFTTQINRFMCLLYIVRNIKL